MPGVFPWVTLALMAASASIAGAANTECGKTAPGLYQGLTMIFGGDYTTIEKNPWQVYLETCFSNGTHGGCGDCGGSIVAKNWVLTAAHCIDHANADYTVYAGSSGKDDHRRQPFKVKRLFIHPRYFSDKIVHNDIALLEIDGEFDLTSATTRTVCLPDSSEADTFEGQRCVASGWGRTQEGQTSSYLKMATLTVTNCHHQWHGYDIRDYHLCAGDWAGDMGTCRGDSGGPLVCSRPDGSQVLAGVVSFGPGCAQPKVVGVYARVSYYDQWIKATMAS